MLNPPHPLVRNGGRLLLTVADMASVLAPFSADCNDTHIFNERWPSHARFYAVVSLGMPGSLGLFVLWQLWRNPGGRGAGRDIAAAVPISYWGSFFPALLVPGTGVDDQPHPVGRVGGVPANVFWATVTVIAALLGWVIDARVSAPRSTCRVKCE
jgi:hypothetical protein